MFNKIIHSRKPTGLIPKALKCSNKTVNIGAMTHEKDAHAECGKNYGSSIPSMPIPLPGICQVFVILMVSAVGNLLENLCRKPSRSG